MGEYPTRSELAIGDFVEIAMYRQGNKKDKGEIESFLTQAETHPHGIMTALTDKKIGRVQRKLPPPAKIPIDLDIAKELHKKIEKLTGAQQRRLLLAEKAQEKRRGAAKKAAALWVHVPAPNEVTRRKDAERMKKMLEKPSQDKQREVFLTKDMPEEEDERNEFKESFKADTIYHKLIKDGQKKMAEARKHDCGSKEHGVKKDVSVAVASF